MRVDCIPMEKKKNMIFFLVKKDLTRSYDYGARICWIIWVSTADDFFGFSWLRSTQSIHTLKFLQVVVHVITIDQ